MDDDEQIGALHNAFLGLCRGKTPEVVYAASRQILAEAIFHSARANKAPPDLQRTMDELARDIRAIVDIAASAEAPRH